MLRCADSTYYTGSTTDLTRRLEEHNKTSLGARYTKSRRPVTIVYSETCLSQSEAFKREAFIKKLSRKAKLSLLSSSVQI